MHKVLKENITKLNAICKEHFVERLYAYGSVCTDRFDKNSDIDLLISFQPMDFGDYADNYFSIIEKFEKTFNRSVDLTTEKSLSNPYFIQSVNQTKTLIYEHRN
jgi:predicted nucleotidyltransferase